MNGAAMTKQQREILYHALGLDYESELFRNGYVTGVSGPQFEACHELEKLGLMTSFTRAWDMGGIHFMVTDAGKEEVMRLWTAQISGAAQDLLTACEKALQFIRNGIEFGCIDMPHDTPEDSANAVPGLLEAAIKKARRAEGREAHLRLIAAAPDLLESLEALLVEWVAMERVHGEHGGREVAMARAAIAKARGDDHA